MSDTLGQRLQERLGIKGTSCIRITVWYFKTRPTFSDGDRLREPNRRFTLCSARSMPSNNAKRLLSCCFAVTEHLWDALKKCQPANKLLDRFWDNPFRRDCLGPIPSSAMPPNRIKSSWDIDMKIQNIEYHVHKWYIRWIRPHIPQEINR